MFWHVLPLALCVAIVDSQACFCNWYLSHHGRHRLKKKIKKKGTNSNPVRIWSDPSVSWKIELLRGWVWRCKLICVIINFSICKLICVVRTTPPKFTTAPLCKWICNKFSYAETWVRKGNPSFVTRENMLRIAVLSLCAVSALAAFNWDRQASKMRVQLYVLMSTLMGLCTHTGATIWSVLRNGPTYALERNSPRLMCATPQITPKFRFHNHCHQCGCFSACKCFNDACLNNAENVDPIRNLTSLASTTNADFGARLLARL